jgi:uncharacterized protein (TIGR03067 family)
MRITMKMKLFAAALAAGFSFGIVGAEDQEKSPAEQLIGTYAIVKGMENGKEIPKESLKESVVTITKDKIVGVTKDQSQLFVADYTVQSDAPGAKEKNVIKLSMKGTKPDEANATGLAKIEGNTVTIIYNLPKGKPPADFKLQEGQHMFVLKRLVKSGENKSESPEK